MRVAPRLTLAVGGSSIAVFAVSGFALYSNERNELTAAARHETVVLGRTLQTAFENALRDGQVEDMGETLETLANAAAGAGVYLLDHEGRVVGASRLGPASPEAVRLGQLARGRSEVVVAWDSPTSPQALRVGLPLEGATKESGWSLVLEDPLTELKRDLSATRTNITFVVLVFILVVTGLTWVLARRYVGTPIAGLVANMRRVRSGELRLTSVSPVTDELRAAITEFEALVRDLESERTRANEEGQARLRLERALQNADKLITLGQLSAVMAHEIGSPLQVLEGRARALMKHADDPSSTRRNAAMLVEQTARIARLVEQMLSLTRRRPALRSEVRVDVALQTVIDLLGFEAARKGVTIRMVRDGRTDIVADPDQIQQVALNLLRNALQASPRETEVTVRLGGTDAELVMDFEDRGPGVSSHSREHLFEPFFTTRADSGGTGLGLSVVKSIVEEHAGRVEFLPVDVGCIARVTLPRRKEGDRP